MEAGVKIVEILTFTRANRAQVKALEKDIFLLELCVGECMLSGIQLHRCMVGSACLAVSARMLPLAE